MGPARPTARHVWYGLLKTASSCSAHHHYPIHCKENMTDAISICVDAVALPVTDDDDQHRPIHARIHCPSHCRHVVPVHLCRIDPAIIHQCRLDDARWHGFG